MKRNLRGPLIGGGSLLLTIVWSGMALTGSPGLPIDATDTVAKSRAAAPLCRSAVDDRQPRGGVPASPHQPPTQEGEQNLLARASFFDATPVGDAHESFVDSEFLSGHLQRLDEKEDSEGTAVGRSAVSEPLSLFLLGTGLFGLAAFKRRLER